MGTVQPVYRVAGIGKRALVAIGAAFALIASLVTVVFLAGPAGSARVPGEVVRYDFGEGSGSVVGDSGSGVPLDLVIGDPGAVSWVPGGGLSIDSGTALSSGVGAAKVVDAVQLSGEVTVEAWVVPAPGEQSGPARLVSNAPNSKNRNFMLGQGAYRQLPDDTFVGRTRTSSSDKGTPELITPAGSAVPEVLTHVVMTRDVSGTRVLYVDGVAVTTDVLGGDVSNWDDSFPLTLVNEAGGSRPWLGTLCLVAVYDVALSASQVGDNYTTGCDLGGTNADPVVDPVGDQSSAEGRSV